MKKKQSSGVDGLSQFKMCLGKTLLAGPLTNIINKFIVSGIFPSNWKEALVTPVLKKGKADQVENCNCWYYLCQLIPI